MKCSLDCERDRHRQGFPRVVGIDEAGRGPLAGPVVAAGVVLPEGFHHDELDDSKKLTASRRASLYAELTDRADIRWPWSRRRKWTGSTSSKPPMWPCAAPWPGWFPIPITR